MARELAARVLLPPSRKPGEKPGFWWLRPVLGLGAVLLALAPVAVGYVGYAASARIADPRRLAYSDDPKRYGLSPQNLALATPNAREPLSGWLFKHANDHGRAVLFLHGWGSHKRHMLRDYLRWLAARYTVVAFDFSNHGESPEGITTLGVREVPEAAMALRWLRAHGYHSVGVLGTSMGGAIAINLAAREPLVKAVVTDGAFARPDNLAYGHFASHGYPFPGLLASSTARWLAWRTGADLGSVAAVKHVAAIAPRPLLLIHGSADHVILPSNANELFAAAREPKALWLVPKADHMSELDRCPHALAAGEYERRVKALFDRI
jgi:pimeloyl-ACP methyl ester carboxylesterase